MSSEPGLGHTSAHNNNNNGNVNGNGNDNKNNNDTANAINVGDGIQAEPVAEPVTEHIQNDGLNGVQELEDEGEELQSLGSDTNGLTFARKRHSQTQQIGTAGQDKEEGTEEGIRDTMEERRSELPLRPKEKAGRPASFESTSTPDDTPSIQGSIVSSPRSSVAYSYNSPRANRPALQPFERRFSSRLSPSPLATPRGASPVFLSAHSRPSSLSSNLFFQQLSDEADTPQPPWDVVRWTKLKKITGQVFSEVGKRNFGRPTCLNVAASLVIGTSKVFILVFDYQQVLKSIIGPGTKGRHHNNRCCFFMLTR